MSDTPETDAAFAKGGDKESDFVRMFRMLDKARSLERRLLSMTADRDEIVKATTELDLQHADHVHELAMQVVNLEAERDKARAMVAVAREALNRAKELLDLFRPIDAYRALSDALAAIDQIGKEGAM